MKSLIAVVLTLFTFLAHAGEVSLMYGAWDGISRTTVAYTGKPFLGIIESKDNKVTYYLEVAPEFGVSQYKDGGETLSQVYFTPKITLWLGSKFFLDGGIGVSMLDGRNLGPKKLSTNFQFTDHIGVSYHINNKSRVGFRFTHVSNADIKKPNPGIDSGQVYLTHAF